jgi:hypothetical protein
MLELAGFLQLLRIACRGRTFCGVTDPTAANRPRTIGGIGYLFLIQGFDLLN